MATEAPNTANAPPLALPLVFFATGLFGLLGEILDLLWHRPELLAFNIGTPGILAATHFMTLGFITMVMMGALYQLIPVVMNTKVASVPLGFWHFGLYALGTGLVIGSMLLFKPMGMMVGGSFIIVAVTIFLINLSATLKSAKSWTISSYFVLAALVYLACTVIMGWLLAFNFVRPIFPSDRELYIHVALGLAGWFTLTLIGVSYKLLPMFALSHAPIKYGWWVFGLINGAIFSVVAGAWFGGAAWSLAGILAFLGTLLYGLDARVLYTSRARHQHDPAVVTALMGPVSLGVFWALLVAGFFDEKLLPAAVYLFFNGWLGFSIIGYLQKIVPFLVWLDRYSDQVGRSRVPRMKDLLSDGASRQIFWLYAPGVGLVTLGLIVRTSTGVALGLGLEMIGVLRLMVSVGVVLWVKPTLSPISLGSLGAKRK